MEPEDDGPLEVHHYQVGIDPGLYKLVMRALSIVMMEHGLTRIEVDVPTMVALDSLCGILGEAFDRNGVRHFNIRVVPLKELNQITDLMTAEPASNKPS